MTYYVRRQKTSQSPYGDFKHLWLGVYIEADKSNHISDCLGELFLLIHDSKGIEDVDEGERVIAGDIVGANV